MVVDRGLGNSLYHGQVWSFQEVAFDLRLENEKKQTRGKEHSRQRNSTSREGTSLVSLKEEGRPVME